MGTEQVAQAEEAVKARKSWKKLTAQEKWRIFLETSVKNAPVGEVLRRYGVYSSELTKIRRQVEEGALKKDATRINEAYAKFVTKNIPFVILKSASSLDGKIALPSGESRWITGKIARRYAHRLRLMVDAVLVGVGTVIADDPLLNVRHIKSKGKQPLRIVLDSRLRIPLTSKILDTSRGQDTLIVTTRSASVEKIEELNKSGVKTVIAENRDDGEISLKSLMNQLGKSGIMSLMIEGGSTISSSALIENIVDKKKSKEQNKGNQNKPKRK